MNKIGGEVLEIRKKREFVQLVEKGVQGRSPPSEGNGNDILETVLGIVGHSGAKGQRH